MERLIISSKDDMQALEQLYRLLKNEAFAFALSILHDSSLSEDCVQEAFVRLPRAARKFTGSAHGKTFIFTIIKNVAYELLRQRSLALSYEDSLFDSEMAAADENMTIREIFDLLTDNQRTALTLHLYSKMTFDEIAEVTGCPPSTVKSRYSAALRIIKKYYI